MTNGILILIAVIVGYLLRDLKIEKVQEARQKIKRKLLGDKSGIVDWEPPKSAEEQAEEEVKKNLKK